MKDKIKYIPAILSLAAGLIASIIAILSGYDTLYIMIITLAALLVFYIAGIIVRNMFEKNFIIEEAGDADDGEAVQNSEDEENGEGTSEGEETEEGSLDENKE